MAELDRMTGAAEPSKADERARIVRASLWNAVVGCWLAGSPWVLNYRDGDATALSVALGICVIVLAGVRALWAWREGWLTYVNMAIGLSLAVSALWLPESRQAIWNQGLVALLLVTIAASTPPGPSRGRSAGASRRAGGPNGRAPRAHP